MDARELPYEVKRLTAPARLRSDPRQLRRENGRLRAARHVSEPRPRLGSGLDYLSLTDLFIVGLALDITGAILLAKGLLISPATISDISATLWGGNPETARDRCRNRVDAEFGVAYLASGFFLQAVGYSLDIGGVSSETGTSRLLAALGMALIAAAVSVGIYAGFHATRERQLIGEAEAEDERRRKEEEERQEREREAREAGV